MSLYREFRAWLAGDGAGAAPVQGLDLDSIVSRPETAKRIARCAAFLPEFEEEVFEETVRTVLAWIGDLPASEAHHHRDPFGLFDHLLHVAELALRRSLTEYFVESTRAWPEEQVHRVPRLRLSVWALGLFHDLGKAVYMRVHGPKRALWNPFVEPLADFYDRHGRTSCTLSWVPGRGMNGHAWMEPVLFGRVMPRRLAEAIGPKALVEALDSRNPASQLISAIVSETDQESARAWVERRAEEERAARRQSLPAPAVLGAPDWVERVPGILADAIADGVFRVNDPTGDLWIAAERVLLRYPKGVAKLARILNDAIGREAIEVRSLAAAETGPRLLADALHRRRWLLHDPDSDAWKLHARITQGDATDSTAVIVLHRVFVEGPLAALGPVPVFDGRIELLRSAGGAALPTPEPVADAPAPAPPPPPPPITPATAPDAAHSPAAPPPAAPRKAKALRRFISPETLLDDIRDAMTDGTIPTNEWNGQAYVAGDVTYMVSPKGFDLLVAAGIYDRDPRREVNAYLDALAKLSCVRKREGGRVLTSIVLRPGARPMWAVAFDTAGLFRSRKLEGRWVQSQIQEITEQEHRAILRDLEANAGERREARDAG